MCIRDRWRKSAISATIAILGVEKNPISSMTILSLCSVFIIAFLACAIPYSHNRTSLTFNKPDVVSIGTVSVEKNYYQPEELTNSTNLCLCQNIDIDSNDWKNQYFHDGIVCQKTTEKLSTLFQAEYDTSGKFQISNNQSHTFLMSFKNKTLSKCYDKIFFKVPVSMYLIPLKHFPAITTCVTYDGITNYLPKLERNLSHIWHFGETCDVEINNMYVPCSNANVTGTIALLSIMIVWMCCSILMIILSKKIGKWLFSKNWSKLFFSFSKSWYGVILFSIVFCLLVILPLLVHCNKRCFI